MKNNDLLKQFASVGLGSVVVMVIGFFTTPIITRVVDPGDYGQLSLFTTYSNISMMLLGLGFDQVLLRYYYSEDSQEYRSSILCKCTLLPGLFYTVMVLLVNTVIFIWNREMLNNKILYLFFIHVLVLLINRMSVLMVRLDGRSIMYSILNIIQKVVYVGVALALLFLIPGDPFVFLVIATVMSYAIPTVISVFIERKYWRFNLGTIKCGVPYHEMLKYGLPMLLSSGIYLVFQATDKVCLEHMCTYRDVGIYASAASLISIVAIIRSSFTTVWMPAAVAHYEKSPDDVGFYIIVNRWITILMFAFGLTLMAGKDIIVMLLGEKYREASGIFPFLLFQPIMYTISETTVVGIILKKNSNMQLLSSIGACIINIILNLLLIPILGAKGASISTGISYIIFFVLRTVLANKCFPIKYETRKFSVLTILTIGFALYSSVTTISIQLFLAYVFVMVVLVLMYRKDVITMMQFLFKYIERKF